MEANIFVCRIHVRNVFGGIEFGGTTGVGNGGDDECVDGVVVYGVCGWLWGIQLGEWNRSSNSELSCSEMHLDRIGVGIVRTGRLLERSTAFAPHHVLDRSSAFVLRCDAYFGKRFGKECFFWRKRGETKQNFGGA